MKIRASVVMVTLLGVMCAACGDSAADKQTIVQVGNARLMPTDVQAEMPLALSGDDSLAFVHDYVKGWVNQQVLFEQGLRNVSNLEELEEQVQEYRRTLIAETYVNEMIESRQWQASEEECRLFYDRYGAELKLDHPIVQGVLVKLQSSSSKIKVVKGWLDQILTGKFKSMDEMEQFCAQKAALYDNFLEEWSPIVRLSDQLPVSIADAPSFLRCKTFELKDDDAVYLFAIKDYRLAGERQPYEVARMQIQELIAQRKRQQYRTQLISELVERGRKSGFIRENAAFFTEVSDADGKSEKIMEESEPKHTSEASGSKADVTVTKNAGAVPASEIGSGHPGMSSGMEGVAPARIPVSADTLKSVNPIVGKQQVNQDSIHQKQDSIHQK